MFSQNRSVWRRLAVCMPVPCCKGGVPLCRASPVTVLFRKSSK